jgi:hypothetical protein
MSGTTARVLSVESLDRFRGKLIEFGKDVKDALCAIDVQIHRAFNWLEERAKYWKHEIRVREEDVVRAKIELQSRKAMCKEGRGPGTTDQEKALRKAQARLKEAEDKALACKRWHPLLQHAVHEYQGPTRVLSGWIDTEMTQAVALLARKIEALEAYLAIAPPSLPQPAGTSSTIVESVANLGYDGTAPAAQEAKPVAAPEPEEEALNAARTIPVQRD